MNSASSEASHLFISYATEDSALATWLARKLASLGYAIWFDQAKMLGGEPWPQTIDDAIKNRTFRMLALISAASLRKPKPTGERVLAQKIADQRSIPDFLIPLKVDGTELDWLTTAISYVPFQAGWAAGFRQLIEKLDDISAPKNLSNATSLAAMSFPTGEDLIVNATEQLRTNVIRVEVIPPGIKAFATDSTLSDDDRDKLDASWAHYRVNPQLFLAFSDPPKEYRGIVSPTKEQWSWVDYDTGAAFILSGIKQFTSRKSLLRMVGLDLQTFGVTLSDLRFEGKLPSSLSADRLSLITTTLLFACG